MSYIDSQIRELREIAEMYEGMDGGELLKECADTIEFLYKKLNEKSNSGWIPCSERLPDKWKDVMICYYNDREEKHLLDIACLDDNWCWQLWRESGGYFPYNFRKKITHWRPLPNLPEECHG